MPLLAAIVTIPILIATLGTERFGILTLIWALVSYFGLFDLGLGRALTQQLAASWARGEQGRADRLIGTALLATVVLGLVAGSLLAAAYMFRVLGHAFGNRAYPQSTVTVAREEWPALVLTGTAVIGLGLAGAPVWQLLGG